MMEPPPAVKAAGVLSRQVPRLNCQGGVRDCPFSTVGFTSRIMFRATETLQKLENSNKNQRKKRK